MLCEFRNSKLTKDGFQSKLIFKKRMFRETDETITEPQFVNLSYVQVRIDLPGRRVLVRSHTDSCRLLANLCMQMQQWHTGGTGLGAISLTSLSLHPDISSAT